MFTRNHLSKPKKATKSKHAKGDAPASPAAGEVPAAAAEGAEGVEGARGTFFKGGPPRVTWRQAELYGLVRYRTAALEAGVGGGVAEGGSALEAGPPDAAAQALAEARGVHFAA